MKKTLLTLLVAAPALVIAQNQNASKVAPEKMTLEKQNSMLIDNEKLNGRIPINPNGEQIKKKKNAVASIALGETYYDLQTNSSPGRRVLLHSDGTVSAVWTASPDDGTGFPNRGTGYNYYNGTDWLTGRDSRIENNNRTGWPSIMLMDDGSESVMAHESNTGGFVYSNNSSKGSTSFTSSGPVLDDESELNVNRVPIWNRSVQSNGKIHIISNYWASEDNNVPVVERDGVSSPTTYSRWDVATNSADVEHILLPGYDSTIYNNGGGDNYAIDARDSVIAIVIGGMGRALSLWKSTDNGETWAYTDVDGFPYKTTITEVEMLDTPLTNDGSVDVLIDAQGMAHVFYGESAVLDDDISDESFSFFPSRHHIRHWKEGDTETKRIGGVIDLDNDGEILQDLNAETWNILSEGSVPNGLLSASRTGNTSLATMPSASIDADGNIFVVFSAPVEGTAHFLNSNFRDIHITYSTDGGATWGETQNVTKQGDWECSFPCVAKVANDFVHLIYQQDLTPGTNLQNHSTSAGTHPIDINEIKYAAIPVTDIINDVIGQDLSNVNDVDRKSEVFVVSQNQPNPFSDNTDVIIYLRKNSEVSLTVTDMLGNVINEGDLGIMSAGNHTVSIDGSMLSSGMYFYTLSTGDHKITKKMQVK